MSDIQNKEQYVSAKILSIKNISKNEYFPPIPQLLLVRECGKATWWRRLQVAVVIKSIGLQGLSGYPVDVEVSVCSGVAVTSIVGLGDAAVKEARDRIEACMSLLDYEVPQKKIIINLSPSGYPGARYFLQVYASFGG